MLKFIGALLFPKFCLSCKKFGRYICVRCTKNLTYLENQICFYCEKKSAYGITHIGCVHVNGVDQFISCFRYTSTLKKIIASIKYRLVSDAFEEIFNLIEKQLTISLIINGDQPFSIQPIPLHPFRQRQRGFNQSEIIAKWLARKTGGRMIQALERVKETKAQAQLGREDRISNAKGAFAMKKGLKLTNFVVVVVDDVVTTGSTVAEATAILKVAGAGKIIVFSIAKD